MIRILLHILVHTLVYITHLAHNLVHTLSHILVHTLAYIFRTVMPLSHILVQTLAYISRTVMPILAHNLAYIVDMNRGQNLTQILHQKTHQITSTTLVLSLNLASTHPLLLTTQTLVVLQAYINLPSSTLLPITPDSATHQKGNHTTTLISHTAQSHTSMISMHQSHVITLVCS